MTVRGALGLGALMLVLSCAASPGAATALTPFQKARLLGHYSSRDGRSGFVLDRLAEPWKVKLDGETEAAPMTAQPGVYDTFEYTTADRRVWLRVDRESGDIQLFQGPKQHYGVPIVRDDDASTLR
ncbi:hypothetical protein [Pendulispora albinea]|uniref:Uncharacterized protein n=1 Tax=Pendulispora albinea TaxID=2741071 RepID=A0ABZ2LXS5_9BACT